MTEEAKFKVGDLFRRKTRTGSDSWYLVTKVEKEEESERIHQMKYPRFPTSSDEAKMLGSNPADIVSNQHEALKKMSLEFERMSMANLPYTIARAMLTCANEEENRVNVSDEVVTALESKVAELDVAMDKGEHVSQMQDTGTDALKAAVDQSEPDS